MDNGLQAQLRIQCATALALPWHIAHRELFKCLKQQLVSLATKQINATDQCNRSDRLIDVTDQIKQIRPHVTPSLRICSAFASINSVGAADGQGLITTGGVITAGDLLIGRASINFPLCSS
jgi:hypothetical protein